ncbi:MAG: caspase family protein, partial [Proteobacteria bacterium]|nr:caspase family protein [Pseudomonadota bacterium]
GVHDNRVLIYDIKSRQVNALKIGRNSEQSPTHTALSPDKTQLVTVSREFKPVSMNLWETDGTLVSQKKTSTAGVIALDIIPDTDVIVTTSGDNQVRYWSLDGRLLHHHPAEYDYPHLLAVTPNGRVVVTGGTDLNLWNMQGDKLATIPIHKIDGRALTFSPDSKFLITGGADGFVNIIPMEKDAKNIRFKAHDGKVISSIAIHPDSHMFATGTTLNEFKIWDMQGKLISAYALPPDSKPPFSAIYDMAFSPDGHRMVTASTRRGEEIKFFDISGKLINTMSVPNRDESGCLAFSATGKWLAVSVNHHIGLWDYSRKTFYRALKGHQDGIRAMKFTKDEQHLVSASSDGSVRVWNVENGQSFSMLSQKDQWVIYTDDGYFDASRYGGEMVAIVDGLNAYGVDQYALHYNRPDIIYSRLNLGSPGFINHFKTCHEKRLSQAKLTESILDKAAQVPQIRILNRSRKDKFIMIDFEAEDTTGNINYIQAYVNDVPLYPGRGKTVGANKIQMTENIELGSGENKIELSAINDRGVESFRSAVYAKHNKKIKGDLYYIGLGVSEYQDTSLNLKYAHKDVMDMGEFVQKYKGHFEKIYRLEIVNEKATRSSLVEIHKFLSTAKVDDTVMFLVTGHGGHDLSDTGTYYFFSHEVQAGKVEQTAITFNELENILGAIAPRKKILFLDTCESGEIDPDLLARIQTSAQEKGLFVRSRNALVRKENIPQRPYLLYRNRYIYNDLSRKTGTIIFSSSLAQESSIESDLIENGIFTEALMLQLMDPETDVNKDGYISIFELETSVKIWVAFATNNLQHPNIERENIYLDFKLPAVQ